MPSKWPAYFEALKRWLDVCSHGADPVEALSGHLCGPQCWHWEALSEERKREFLKAPWNDTR